MLNLEKAKDYPTLFRYLKVISLETFSPELRIVAKSNFVIPKILTTTFAVKNAIK